MASRVPKGIRAVQDLKIAPEEIIYLVEEMAHRHEEKQAGEVDWYTAMAITGEKYKDDHQRCFCIMERMRCFLPMLEDARMRGWTMRGREEGCLFTNEAIFRAVARCPLKADSRRMWFDNDEFFGVALSEAESQGTA